MADEQIDQQSTQETNPLAEHRDTLREAVNKAIDTVTGSGSDDVENDAVSDSDKGDENDSSTKTKKAETKESSLDETELAQAQQLYLALKDPEQAPAVIEYIAKQAGYSKIETVKQAEEAKDAVLEALQESLGPDFEFLTPKLSKAINKILETKLSEHTQDIRENIAQERESKIRGETTTAYTTLSQKYFGKDEMPQNVMAEMSKLMETYKPATGMTVSDYLKDMLHTAASRLDFDLRNVKKNQQNETRVAKNRTDAVGRLASERGAITESHVVGTPQNKKLSINEAIKRAEEEVSEKMLQEK